MSTGENTGSGHVLSTSDELDLLFDLNTGILIDDAMIQSNDLDYFSLDCKTGITDDVFKELLQIPDSEIQDQSSDTVYTTEIHSPVSSDSGISEDQKSPYHNSSEASPNNLEEIQFTEMYQSEANPAGIDEIPLTESYVETFDLDSILTGSDAMLIDGNLITVTTSDGKSTDMTIQFTEPTKEPMKYVKTATDSLPLFLREDKSSLENINTDSKTFPALTLTDEEKKLLDDANIILPSHYPLTKDEEKALKGVRRKIRNKISAQDSRKRKKEYVDGLEQRVQNCTRQNIELRRKMERIEKENKSLLDQLKDLKSLVAQTTAKSVSKSTCVMVMLLSFSLFIAPSFNLFKSSPMPQGRQNVGIVSRTLLEVDEAQGDDVSYTTVSPGTVETDDDQMFWRKNKMINNNVEEGDELKMVPPMNLAENTAADAPNSGSQSTQNLTVVPSSAPSIVKSRKADTHIRNDDL